MDELKEKLSDLLMSVFKNCFIDVNMDVLEYVDFIDDLEIDSITFVTLLIEIEASFNIIIPDAIMFKERFRTFDSIINLILELSN